MSPFIAPRAPSSWSFSALPTSHAFPTGEPGNRGIHEGDGLDVFRELARIRIRDNPSHVVSNDVHRRQLQIRQQPAKMLRERLLVVGIGDARVAKPWQVWRDDAVLLCKVWHDVAPFESLLRPSVKEDNHVARTACYVVPSYCANLS